MHDTNAKLLDLRVEMHQYLYHQLLDRPIVLQISANSIYNNSIHARTGSMCTGYWNSGVEKTKFIRERFPCELGRKMKDPLGWGGGWKLHKICNLLGGTTVLVNLSERGQYVLLIPSTWINQDIHSTTHHWDNGRSLFRCSCYCAWSLLLIRFLQTESVT